MKQGELSNDIMTNRHAGIRLSITRVYVRDRLIVMRESEGALYVHSNHKHFDSNLSGMISAAGKAIGGAEAFHFLVFPSLLS